MPATAKQLFEASVDQVRRGQIRTALSTLLATLEQDPGHVGALEAAGRICRLLGSAEDAELFEELAARPDDGDAQYALGFRLVDEGRPEVAAALLARSLASQPGSPEIRRELAYARLQAGDFAGCLRALAPLQDDPALAEREQLDVLLLSAEAALCSGRRDVAQDFLRTAEDLLPDDDQRERLDALHAMIGRSLRWPSLTGLGLREWHFIQHAGVILKTAGGFFEDGSRQGRYDVLDLRLDMVAFLLQRLADLLARLGLEHEVVIPTSPVAAPLAHALALRLGVGVAEDVSQRNGRPALLVAANALEFGPLTAGLATHRAELRLFALNLDWERDAPVFPEVAGVLARRVLLPWETRYSLDPKTGQMRELPGDERPAAEIGAELFAAMEALPQDGGTAREEFESFYMPLASQLVLGNEELHPNRRRFTRLSPCGAGLRERSDRAPRAGRGADERGGAGERGRPGEGGLDDAPDEPADGGDGDGEDARDG